MLEVVDAAYSYSELKRMTKAQLKTLAGVKFTDHITREQLICPDSTRQGIGMTSLELLNHRNELIGRINETIERTVNAGHNLTTRRSQLVEAINDLV